MITAPQGLRTVDGEPVLAFNDDGDPLILGYLGLEATRSRLRVPLSGIGHTTVVAVLPVAGIELWALGGADDNYDLCRVLAWAVNAEGSGVPLVLNRARGELEPVVHLPEKTDCTFLCDADFFVGDEAQARQALADRRRRDGQADDLEQG